ncbi:MAG TPA: branched-chain amino acid ABC transporter permease [Oscillatoriales cyanobacterium M59_W2019_021]|nr:MAG: branched-chain amino acid ABC transporter permease [Cyanobacteria bacterium J055]HIK29797.1 branched-chain amino acid ABC transporter permease [Oscillatoriales cyanobacterium M4454_W2019_049]HIK50577.1 branched-chain amino acid ABC transporter permease [Oscillatoriales cyanobacterium M59_W2019_021]
MTNKLSGIWGTIAAVTVILFGGWSGVVIGWLLGTAVGFTRCWERRILSPKEGAKLGGESGLTIGLWLLGATLLQGFIAPILGQPRVSLIQIILQGIVALGVTTFSAAVMGSLQGLPFDRRRWATLITFAFVLVLFPFVDGLARTSWLPTAILILIFVMLALGLNITVGFAGLLDLGYAAFFAIGAYTTGFLSSPQLGNSWNFWLVLPIAAAVAGIFGVILGSPTLRLRGDYLAIVTLGFGEIVPVVFRNLTDLRINEPISSVLATLLNRPDMAICLVGCEKAVNLTGGEAGINPIGRPTLPIVGTFDSTDYFPWYYLILALAVGSFWAISRLKDSRLGRAWEAIREDELAASAMGINRVKTKLLAFAMGATFSGFAGSFYAAYLSAIFPSVFDFSVSVIILCMVILGGLGNMSGVVLGSVIIMAADRLYLPQLAQVLKSFLNTAVLPNLSNPQLRDFIATSLDPIQMRLFLFGLTLVIMMIVRPEGLLPDAIHRAELHSENEENHEPLTPERSS